MARVYEKGEKIQSYTIEGLKAIGDCAMSYFAHDESGEKVFLKIYKSPTKRYAAVFQQFVEQQLFLKEKLDHIENAETILEVMEIENAFHCQVKEFINGIDLSGYLIEKQLAHDEKITLALHIVNSLMQIHENGIVHTDLKKEQIIVEKPSDHTGLPTIRLIGFDFSRIPQVHEPVYRLATPNYASPEYLRNEPADFSSDVFALGIILFELFCNEYPYNIHTRTIDYATLALNHRIKAKPIFINSEIGGDLSELVYHMLNPNKHKRPNISEIQEALIRARNSLFL